jgi:hypothetical protein
MTVEPWDGGSLPDALVPNNPPSDDPVSQGDDHFRLVKTVVSNFYAAYLAESAEFLAALEALEAAVASGIVYEASRFGGELPAFYLDSGNQATGTLPAGRLAGTYGIDITGNAATATNADHADAATLADEAVIAQDSEKLGGQTLTEIKSTLPVGIEYSTVSTVSIPGFGTAVWVSSIPVPSQAGTTGAFVYTSAGVTVSPPYDTYITIRAMPDDVAVGDATFHATGVGRLPVNTTHLKVTGTGSNVGGPSVRVASGLSLQMDFLMTPAP